MEKAQTEARELPGSPGRLTPRQAQILGLMAKGLTPRQIAESLDVRFYTVATHIKRIFRKLAVHHRAEAVAVAFKHGLVDATPPVAGPAFCPCCGWHFRTSLNPGRRPRRLATALSPISISQVST